MFNEGNMISHERLKELVDYDPDTGIFRWKAKAAARVKIGEVFGSLGTGGYLTVFLEKKCYPLHVLAMFYTDGVWPSELVDHKDLNKTNNKRNNLRLATKSQNNRNCKIRKDNRSGVKGVSYRDKSGGQWVCRIHTDSGRKYIGCFKTKEEATAIMKIAREEHHGEFANHG